MIRARIAARRRVCQHSRLRFQCFLASRHANQSLCTLARELPNLSLAGYWWHIFFPEIIRQVIGERLDMLPLRSGAKTRPAFMVTRSVSVEVAHFPES